MRERKVADRQDDPSTDVAMPVALQLARHVGMLEGRVKSYEERIYVKEGEVVHLERELRLAREQVQRYQGIVRRLEERLDPHRTIKRLAKMGFATCALTTVVYLVTGVPIFNPFFSSLAMVACIVFWIMASFSERSAKS